MDPIQVGALARSQSSHAACPTAYDAATTAAASDAAAAAAPNDDSGDSPEATISISKMPSPTKRVGRLSASPKLRHPRAPS